MALIKVTNVIYFEVDDIEQGQEVCNDLETGLIPNLDNFPTGEAISVNVEKYEEVSEEEANEQGLVE